MSDGLKLLTSLLESGSIRDLQDLTQDVFIDEELPVHTFVRSHYRRYGVLPTIDTVEADLSIRLPQTGETYAYYKQKLADRYLYGQLRPGFDTLRDNLRDFNMEGARTAVDQLRAAVRVAHVDRDIRNFREASDGVMQEYDEAHRSPGLSGVPSGWSFMDETTGGYQPGDLATWVARLGMGKTYMLLKQADAAWCAGHNVGIITMEMSIVQLARRQLAMQCGINPDVIRKGRLSTYTKRRLSGHIQHLQNTDRFHIFAGNFGKNLDDMDVFLHEFRPDILFIDGSYLMKPETGKRSLSRLERVPEVFDGLKKSAVVHNVPIVNTTQFARGAGKQGKEGSLENIGFSDAIAQNSSLVFALKEGEPPFQTSRRTIEILKGREGESGKFYTHYSFAPMNFGEIVVDNQNRRAIAERPVVDIEALDTVQS